MALNIGNLNFGVDARTEGIDKAIKKIAQFQKLTDQAARSQKKGAEQVTRAMLNREKEMRKATREAIAFQKQMQKSGKSKKEINAVNQILTKLTSQLGRAKVSQTQMNRAVQDFADKMGKAKRDLSKFNDTTSKGKVGLGKYTFLIRDLESSAVLALGPLSGLGARIRSLSAIFGRSGLALAALIAGIAVAVIAFGKLAVEMVKAGSAMQSLELRFEAATGSIEAGGKAMDTVKIIARKYGLEVEGLAKSYSRFLAASQGTSIEGKKSAKIFEQIAKAAAALKLSGSDVEGVMRAIEQIMSKGTVQAEELRGQLGDRIPGAFRMAAEAMGKTTRELNKMLKAGELISDEFLPKFGDIVEESLGKNALKNVTTLTGAWNLLKTNTLLTLDSWDEFTGISDEVSITLQGVAKAMQWMERGPMPDLREQVIITDKAWQAYSKALDGTLIEHYQLNAAIRDFPKQMPALIYQMEKSVRDMTDANVAHKRSWELVADTLREFEQEQSTSKVFEKVSGDIQDMADEYLALGRAMEVAGGNATALDTLITFYAESEKLAKATTGDLEALAAILSEALGRDVGVSITEVASAIATLEHHLDTLTDKADKIRKFDEGMKGITATMDLLRGRLAALKAGGDAIDIFDEITAKGMAFEQVLEKVITDEGMRNVILTKYKALLSEIVPLEDARKEAIKEANAAEREAESRKERAAKAIAKANDQLAIMKQRLQAIGRGPDSLEMFEKVIEPLMKMEQQLADQHVSLTERNVILEKYEELLRAQYQLTGRLQRAADSMAAATVNGLEEIIMKADSSTEALKALGRELLRIWLRAMVLDKLQTTLGAFFGVAFGTGAGATAGAGSSIPTGVGQYARGGSFRLPGSGGSDSVPFFGLGKPGETVSVQRPDQILARGGGGGGVTIHQYNTFENATPDPAILIPILEDNNRKLVGEFLDKLDRGSYS